VTAAFSLGMSICTAAKGAVLSDLAAFSELKASTKALFTSCYNACSLAIKASASLSCVGLVTSDTAAYSGPGLSTLTTV
jgi:hypothetical protein